MSLPTASTQYDDMTGTCAMDWHTGSELHQFAKSKGVDTDRYFPIGLMFTGVPPISFTVYAVDTNVTGYGHKDIGEYAKKVGGNLPIVEFEFSATWNDVAKYMKRLEVIAYQKVENVKSFHTIDKVQLD